jgi:hypothetical protein
MLRSLLLILFATVAVGCCGTSRTAREEVFPSFLINLNGVRSDLVLDYYATLSGMQLVASSNVNSRAAKIVIQPLIDLKKSELLRAVEKALLEQAGIVVTKLDEKRVSITYNDALPVNAVTPRAVRVPFIMPDGKPYIYDPRLPVGKSFLRIER